MNILLVYPQFPDTFWSFKHALRFVGKNASSQPLGLLTVAALLPKYWNKRVIDLNCTELTNDDLKWSDLVMISAMNIQKKSALEIVNRCNRLGTKIVAGGPLFTAEHDKFHTIDYFVLNEAELTLPYFIKDFENGVPKRIYTTKKFADIKSSPQPMWELIDFKNYVSMNIQYSRGCPFNCDFCNITTLFGHQPRIKSSRQIIQELDTLYNLGWRKNIFFVDDNLIGNKRALMDDLLPALIEWRKGKIGITFTTEASINLADDDKLMKMLVAAGFDAVFIGIETTDDLSLAECNKTQNINRDMVDCVKRIQGLGLQVQGGFILGFDSDTSSTFQKMIDFVQKSGIITAMVGLLQAPLDTKLHERLKLEGRIITGISGDNADGETNIVTKMNFEKLSNGYKYVMSQLYSPKLFNKRVRIFFKEYRAPKDKLKNGFRNNNNNLLAFFRSVYILGIKDSARAHYWGLFWWTLFRKPNMMGLAMTFAVYGYHFRMIIEKYIK